MKFQLIMLLLGQATIAMADGKITPDEVIGAIVTLVKMHGGDLDGKAFSVDVVDGNLVITIKKNFLDKIKF